MGVAGLTQDLKQSRVGHEEESGEEETLFLQVASERLLTDLELLEQMGEQLAQSVITHAALHHVGVLVRALHDLDPGFVDGREPFRLLRQLFGDVTTNEDSL